MSPVREASLTALREIRRNLGSTKGIAMVVLFFLSGLFLPMIEVVGRTLLGKGGETVTPEAKQAVYEQLLRATYTDSAVVDHLAPCPWMILSSFELTLMFVPGFILIIGFDQIAGDIQHRAIRYIAGRSRRGSIVAGKALGVWAVVSLMMLVLNLVVWVLTLTQEPSRVGAVFAWGPRLWLFSIAATAAYVGVVALVSALVRTPVVALFVGLGAFIFMGLTRRALDYFESTKVLAWAFPGSYATLLVSPDPKKMLAGLGLYLAWGTVMVVLAAFIVKRRDI